jgi:hypothetical protein
MSTVSAAFEIDDGRVRSKLRIYGVPLTDGNTVAYPVMIVSAAHRYFRHLELLLCGLLGLPF